MTIIVVNDVRYGMKVKGITRIESRTEGLLATNQLGTLQSQKGENCCAPWANSTGQPQRIPWQIWCSPHIWSVNASASKSLVDRCWIPHSKGHSKSTWNQDPSTDGSQNSENMRWAKLLYSVASWIWNHYYPNAKMLEIDPRTLCTIIFWWPPNIHHHLRGDLSLGIWWNLMESGSKPSDFRLKNPRLGVLQ